MIDTLIMLIIWITVFVIAAWGIRWVCTQFNLPQPVLWVCGVLLLVCILLFLSHQSGVMPALRR